MKRRIGFRLGRPLTGLALAIALTSACMETDPAQAEATTSALTPLPAAPGSYVYFRTSATSWDASAASLMTKMDAATWRKQVQVSQSWMLNGTAIFTVTNALNGWGTQNGSLTDVSHLSSPYVVPGFRTPLSESGTNFQVRFPSTGQYEVIFYADTQSFVIRPVTQTPAIVAPVDGTPLRTTNQTFTWAGNADEYWLAVGTSLHGTDVLSTGSLGKATSYTVKNLPLNGSKLYVELRSRIGSSTVASQATYTAPIRRGLCVVADFSDTRLEDWTGDGVNSLNDISTQLRAMEDHWTWLSVGKERIRWDTIRVTLPQARTATAFSGLVPYRAAVVQLARQQIDASNYDVDGDGVMDAVWIIASNRGMSADYLAIGAWLTGEARVFVDLQDGQSLQQGAYGNFNHELGHCLGLVDLYGPYSTVAGLSLMADSWPTPARDFSAFDRYKLGWLDVQVVSRTTSNVSLSLANSRLKAIKIPTARSYEYFLLEYRKTPASSYGSGIPAYNGVIVYHVLEGSRQDLNPPLVKVEPADGVITRDSIPEVDDLLYPGNPVMTMPLQERTYFGTDEVFRIENVRWDANDSIVFDITISTIGAGPPNLLTNGSFEQGNATAPNDWTPDWSPLSTLTWTTEAARTGTRSVSISTPASGGQYAWRREVSNLTAGQTYVLCGWLKGENIKSAGDALVGANVSADYTANDRYNVFRSFDGGFGTFGWQPFCSGFQTPTGNATLSCGLGNQFSSASGKMWCDDMSLVVPRPAWFRLD